LQKGAIAQIGTPHNIYFAPGNRFVAEFIGAADIVEAPLDESFLAATGRTSADPRDWQRAGGRGDDPG
jgi:putative spermidine/putrescine transport system ATP-binding protein